jgi:hypothetical protein
MLRVGREEEEEEDDDEGTSRAKRVIERKKERIGYLEAWAGINSRRLDCEDPREGPRAGLLI